MKKNNLTTQANNASEKDITVINNSLNATKEQALQIKCTTEEDNANEVTDNSWQDDFDTLLEKFIKEQLTDDDLAKKKELELFGEPGRDNVDDEENSEDEMSVDEDDEEKDTDFDENEEEEWADDDEESPRTRYDEEEYTPDAFLRSLDHLVGLENLKKKLKRYDRIIRFNKLRMDNCLSISSTPLHAMFLGSPGTGKTTVAKLMGKMLSRLGILSKGHVVIRERSTLMGPYYSNEETLTREAIEEAKGGILFIDEAYQLYQPHDPRDPGKFVIETLLTALADEENRDWMLILAGYTDEMMAMFNMNPGFKSRIPESNIYTFDDFNAKELLEIAEQYFLRNDYVLTSKARTALKRRLEEDYKNKDKNFGNARHVINLIQTEIVPSIAQRVIDANTTDFESLCKILPCDIPVPTKKKVEKIPSRPRIGFCA